jgi:hypothetical protein
LVPHPFDTWPHLPAQAVAIGIGVQPHTLGTPGLPPPQVCPVGQLPLIVPQVNIAVLHPLSTVPQFLPVGHAVAGLHVEAHVPLEHTMPLGQAPAMLPQLTLPLQPSGIVPQLRVPQTAAAVFGVHPHTLATEGVPPPHV